MSHPCREPNCVAMSDKKDYPCSAHLRHPYLKNQQNDGVPDCAPNVRDYINDLQRELDERNDQLGDLEEKIANAAEALGY